MARKKPPNRKSRTPKSAPRHGLSAFLPEGTMHALTPSPQTTVHFLKQVIGVLLIPVCWVFAETFLILCHADTFTGNYWKSPEFVSLAIGGAIWLALFYCARCRAMMYLYVAGHELTHALFVMICRGKVTDVHISSEGGHILTNRNNFLISLSPYFFPFYTAVTILVWAILQWILRDQGGLDLIWLYGAIGFTWMFHLTFTIWMICREQPDLQQNGHFFSFPLIILMNIIVISALIVIASPTATFYGFGVSLWENTKSFHHRLVESALELIRALPG